MHLLVNRAGLSEFLFDQFFSLELKPVQIDLKKKTELQQNAIMRGSNSSSCVAPSAI
jgi:hypothetical protein